MDLQMRQMSVLCQVKAKGVFEGTCHLCVSVGLDCGKMKDIGVENLLRCYDFTKGVLKDQCLSGYILILERDYGSINTRNV